MGILNRTSAMWEYTIAKYNVLSVLDTVECVINKRNLESEDIYKLNKYRGRLKYYFDQYKYRYENNLNMYTFSCKVNVCMQDILSYIKNRLGTY